MLYWADLSSLDEVLVDVLLEANVGELLRGRDAKELEESGIGLDEAAVAETLLLHVGTEGLGDLRARGRGVLALTEEEAELIRDGLGLLDRDNGRGAIGVELTGNLALLLGILHLLGEALLHTLEVGEHTLESGNLGLNSGLESLELLAGSDLNRGGDLSNRLGGDDRLGLSLGSLGDLGLSLGRCRGSGLGVNLGIGLLHGLGRGSSSGSRGGGGLWHFASGGGIHLRVFYARLCLSLQRETAGNFLESDRVFFQKLDCVYFFF